MFTRAEGYFESAAFLPPEAGRDHESVVDGSVLAAVRSALPVIQMLAFLDLLREGIGQGGGRGCPDFEGDVLKVLKTGAGLPR